MHRSRAAWISGVLIAIALSGCTEGGAPETPVGTDDVSGALADAEVLGPESSVAAPVWEQGQYYGHHVFFGASDTTGIHINTVVASTEGSTYKLLSDNREVSVFEATFDVPILGELSKSDLSTTAFGGAWDLYDFPITDGKTWSAEITGELDDYLNPVTRSATVTAIYNPEVPMPGSSATNPGFDIVGVSDGVTLFETNWVPAIGWYASFTLYDITTEDPEDYLFFVRSMGFGNDFAAELGGVVYDIEGIEHIRHIHVSIAPEMDAGQVYVDGFDLPEEATHLVGFQFAFAGVAGQSTNQLLDPNGQNHGYTAVVVPNGGDPFSWAAGAGTEGDAFEEYPLVVGRWEYMQENAGFVSGGGAFIFELRENQIIF